MSVSPQDSVSALDLECGLLTAAAKGTANGIVVTDARGEILWANPAFTRITGYEFSEVRGQNPRLLKSGRQDATFYSEMWQCIRSGKVWRGEVVNRRKDGSLYIEDMTITPITGAMLGGLPGPAMSHIPPIS